MPLLNQRNLEITLQKLASQNTFSNILEQYPTDAHTASSILNLAFMDGNIEGKTIADFGAGNGIFSVGCALLGAEKVYSVELDPSVVEILRENTNGMEVSVINASVNDFHEKVDTVIMNPPFGSVKKGADFPFMERAVELSNYIYSIHNKKTRTFVENFYSSKGEIFRISDMMIRVPRIYQHHRHDFEEIESTLFCVKLAR
jgi:FkbM family methyltransferase